MIQELQNKIRILEAQVGKLSDNSSRNSQRIIPKQNDTTLPRVSLTNNQRGGQKKIHQTETLLQHVYCFHTLITHTRSFKIQNPLCNQLKSQTFQQTP